MPETPAILAERLQNEEVKTLEFFRNLNPMNWEQPIYSEGSQWTVRQILAHFVSAEKGIDRLIADVLDGGTGAPEDFDIDVYNERSVANFQDVTLEVLLEQFTQVRRQTIDLVARLDQPDLERIGRHPFLGLSPLVDIIKLIYRHNQIHQREIRKALS